MKQQIRHDYIFAFFLTMILNENRLKYHTLFIFKIRKMLQNVLSAAVLISANRKFVFWYLIYDISFSTSCNTKV